MIGVFKQIDRTDNSERDNILNWSNLCNLFEGSVEPAVAHVAVSSVILDADILIVNKIKNKDKPKITLDAQIEQEEDIIVSGSAPGGNGAIVETPDGDEVEVPTTGDETTGDETTGEE